MNEPIRELWAGNKLYLVPESVFQESARKYDAAMEKQRLFDLERKQKEDFYNQIFAYFEIHPLFENSYDWQIDRQRLMPEYQDQYVSSQQIKEIFETVLGRELVGAEWNKYSQGFSRRMSLHFPKAAKYKKWVAKDKSAYVWYGFKLKNF